MQAGRAAAEEALRAAQGELRALKEQQRLDFERIGLLSEEHAALQVLFPCQDSHVFLPGCRYEAESLGVSGGMTACVKSCLRVTHVWLCAAGAG